MMMTALEDVWETPSTAAVEAADKEADDQIAAVWSLARIQNEQANLMLRRLRGWKDIINGLASYFDELAKLESSYGKMHQRLASALNSSEPSYGNLSTSLGALREYSKKVSQKHINLGWVLADQCNNRLQQLRRCIEQDVQQITNDIIRHQVSLRNLRLETVQSLTVFEKAYWSSEASRDHSAGDPWLTQKILSAKCERVEAEEKNFNESMLGFYSELSKIDSYLMENVQIVLQNFAGWNTTLDQEIIAAHDDIGELCAAIQPKLSFAEFARNSQLNDNSFWQQPVTPLQYRYKGGPLTAVFKYGYLQRRVGTVKMSWRDSLVVISECAFLHCFDADGLTTNGANPIDIADRSSPVISISLRKSVLDAPQMPAPHQYSFDLITTSSRFVSVMGSTRLSLQAASHEEMLSWISAIQQKSERTASSSPDDSSDDALAADDFVVITPSPSRIPSSLDDQPPTDSTTQNAVDFGVLSMSTSQPAAATLTSSLPSSTIPSTPQTQTQTLSPSLSPSQNDTFLNDELEDL